jgi:hypothetical protein
LRVAAVGVAVTAWTIRELQTWRLAARFAPLFGWVRISWVRISNGCHRWLIILGGRRLRGARVRAGRGDQREGEDDVEAPHGAELSRSSVRAQSCRVWMLDNTMCCTDFAWGVVPRTMFAWYRSLMGSGDVTAFSIDREFSTMLT